MAQAAPVDQSSGLPTPPFVNDDPFGLAGSDAPQDPALVRSMAVPGGQPSGDDAEGAPWEAPTQDEWEGLEDKAERAEQAASNAQDLVARSQELIAQAVSGQSKTEPTPLAEPIGPPPNPADDPEAFGNWLIKRDEQQERKLVASMNQVQSNVAQMNTANDLYSNFMDKHPALKETPNVRDLMIVAGKLKSVNANDPQEKIFKAVEDQFGAWGIDLGEKPAGHVPEATRTGGVGGGSGRRRRRTAKVEEKPPMDFVDQITEDQVRLGLA